MTDDFNAIFNSSPATETQIEQLDDEHPTDVVEQEPSEEAETAAVQTDAVHATHDEVDEDTKSGKSVPLPTFLDMRDRMKAAEKLAAEHQARLDELNKSRVVDIPDYYNDPKGYADQRFDQLEKQRLDDKIMMSGEFAKRQHGADAVAAAANWASAQAQADPKFDAMVASQPDPIEWVIQQHKVAVQQSEFLTDPVAAARKIALEQGWFSDSDNASQESAQANTGVATPTQATKKRPTTLNDVRASISKPTQQSETESFNSLFNKR